MVLSTGKLTHQLAGGKGAGLGGLTPCRSPGLAL